jgi:phytanoyl-CoA hydroxylase
MMSNIPSVAFDSQQLETIGTLLSDEGYVRIENVFSEEELTEMQNAMTHIVNELDPESESAKPVFSTQDEKKHVADQYFLDSVSKVSYFYEEGALTEDGRLTVAKQRALNKVGHALHWLNPTFKKYTFHDKIKKIIRLCDAVRPQIVQSMYIFKQPNIGGAVTDHVDGTFLHVNPPNRLIGVWIALDTATVKNGCLWFIPKSHQGGKLEYFFVRNNGDDGKLLKYTGDKPVYEQSKFIPVEVKAGSLVLIDGLVAHKSEPNTSTTSRHAYTFHVVDKRDDTPWPTTNWLQETDTYKFPFLFDHS